MKGATAKVQPKADNFNWWRQKAIESHKIHPRRKFIFGQKGKKTRGFIPAEEGCPE